MKVILWKYFYCVALSIPKDKKDEWKHWMQNTHIPDVLKSGAFVDGLTELNDVISPDDETTGLCSFEIRYYAESLKDIERYQSGEGIQRKEEYSMKYGSVTCNVSRRIGQTKPYETSHP